MIEMKQVRFGEDHPLARARWIWSDGNCYLNNCHAQFRYDFQLDSVPAHPFFSSVRISSTGFM